MIDNYDTIKPLLNFETDQVFFLIQILRRRKENLDQGPNNILLKDYFIKSQEDLDKKYNEIRSMCDHFNARAYIRLNRCYYDQALMETLKLLVEYLQLGIPQKAIAAFTTACGHRCYDKEKKWIVDVDFKDGFDEDRLRELILSANSGFDNNIITKIPSANGYHWITRPFDTRDLMREFPALDIHKNNPTNLYIP